MKWDVILELMDGRRQEATPARPFLPLEAVRDDLRGTALAEGMKTLLMDGIDKMIQGHTDLSEILQVCRHEKDVRQNRA